MSTVVQSAAKRVAELIADGVASEPVFQVVCRELAEIVAADWVALVRVDAGDCAGGMIVAAVHGGGAAVPTWEAAPDLTAVSALICESERPVRLGGDAAGDEATTSWLADHEIDSLVGTRVIIAGRLWGLAVAGWRIGGARAPAGATEQLVSALQVLSVGLAYAQSRTDLAASNARIVAAADDARRRIERDLHDGVQQHIVTTLLEVRAAERMAEAAGLEPLRKKLSQIGSALDSTCIELREIARGIHPAILTRRGLAAAVNILARRAQLPVTVEIPRDLPLAPPIQMAAYYVVSEALTNTTKHADASIVEIRAEVRAGQLVLSIHDDGIGGAHTGRGSGLTGLIDRVHALGGSLQIASPPGAGTLLSVTLPTLTPDAPPGA